MKTVLLVLFLLEFIMMGNGQLETKTKVKEVSHYQDARATQVNFRTCNPPCGSFQICLLGVCEGGPGPDILPWFCPPGEVWDPKLQECIGGLGPVLPPCPSGQVWDPKLQECIGGLGPVIPPCPPGEVWDPELQECIGELGPVILSCPPGEVWDPKLQECTGGLRPVIPGCPSGEVWDLKLQECVPEDWIPITTEITDNCPPGEDLDPIRHACVPDWLPITTTSTTWIPTTTVPVATTTSTIYLGCTPPCGQLEYCFFGGCVPVIATRSYTTTIKPVITTTYSRIPTTTSLLRIQTTTVPVATTTSTINLGCTPPCGQFEYCFFGGCVPVIATRSYTTNIKPVITTTNSRIPTTTSLLRIQTTTVPVAATTSTIYLGCTPPCGQFEYCFFGGCVPVKATSSCTTTIKPVITTTYTYYY